jgi:hypothetical protein
MKIQNLIKDHLAHYLLYIKTKCNKRRNALQVKINKVQTKNKKTFLQ